MILLIQMYETTPIDIAEKKIFEKRALHTEHANFHFLHIYVLWKMFC